MKAVEVQQAKWREASSAKAISWGLCNHSGLSLRKLPPCRRLDCYRAWCLAVATLIALLSSYDAFGEEYAQFKSFLTASRPPVKFIRFSRSSSLYSLNGNSIAKDVFYEASLQPGTYFIKESGNLWSHQKQDVSMAGMSHNEYWLINERNQVLVANRNPNVAGSNTPPETLNGTKYDMAEEALNFGINFLDRSTTSWSGNDFTAKSTRADFGNISGRILEGDGTSPKSLEYTYSGKEGSKVLLNYYHESDPDRPAWCPHLVVSSAPSIKSAKPYTNSIQVLTIGIATVGENGYAFTDFYSGNLSMGNLIIFSNGIGNILVGTNFDKIAKTEPTFKIKDRGKIRTLFWGFLILTALLFGWYIARCHPGFQKTGKIK